MAKRTACRATTLRGTQCTRPTEGSRFCWQHKHYPRPLRRSAVWQWFGVVGAIASILALLIGDLALRPGRIVETLTHLPLLEDRFHPLPESDPDRFTVLVAILERDEDQGVRDTLVQRLVDQDGIEVLAIERRVLNLGMQPQKAITSGHSKALHVLERVEADILVWGAVLGSDDAPSLKLYWTMRESVATASRWYSRGQLVEVALDDMQVALQLFIMAKYTEFVRNRGLIELEQLEPFIEKAQTLVDDRGFSPHRSTAALTLVASYALAVFGQQSGQLEPLEQAAKGFERCAPFFNAKDNFPGWIMSQTGRATTLGILGQRMGDAKRLEQAVTTYREVLKAYPKELDSMGWATTTSNFGNALSALGRLSAEPERLEEAIGAYERAREEFRRNGSDVDVANMDSQLASSLADLARFKAGSDSLLTAVSILRDVLNRLDPNEHPLPWAEAQLALGRTLGELGEISGNPETLKQSVAEFDLALSVLDEKRSPKLWAATQSDLAFSLRLLGQGDASTERLDRAVASCQAALRVFKPDGTPIEYARAKLNLGAALFRLGERQRSCEKVKLAVTAFEQATQYFRGRDQAKWAISQENVGNAFVKLGELLGDESVVRKALPFFTEALSAWSAEKRPVRFAMTQTNLGSAHLTLAGWYEQREDEARKAIVHYETALGALRRSGVETRVSREAEYGIEFSKMLLDGKLAKAPPRWNPDCS